MKPTIPNKTSIATKSDKVYTPYDTAKFIVDYYHPEWSILEPAAWKNIFYDLFKWNKYRCEIDDWIDFFDFEWHVDWIITNPPYSIYDLFLEKSFEVADNVVLFVPIAKAFKSNKVQSMVKKYWWLKEMIYMWWGSKHWFWFWFPVWCLYYKRWYSWDCKITNNIL